MTAEPTPHHVPDWDDVRGQFPILDSEVDGRPLAYLDNAASSQMPQRVINRIVRYQSEEHSNVHRGVHYLSQRATDAFEEARTRVRGFINAPEERECIFVRGTTEAINLVMHGWGRQSVGEGDVILISHLEHHSNIVPWQMLCEEKGATLRVIPMSDDGVLDFQAFEEMLDDRVKLLGLVHVSNALGTVNDVRRFADAAHAAGIPVLVDGAQAVPHMEVDVQALGADFYAFSGHKMFGPTGAGVLWGRAELLEEMQPFMGGGEMILDVSFEETTYNVIPHKFEAGTPPIMPVVALSEAIAFLDDLGMEHVERREAELMRYATETLGQIDFVQILGPEHRAGVLSLVVDGVHPHDVGTILDHAGVAVRAGHHCAQPVMKRLGVAATARASLAFYNTTDDIDALADGLRSVKEIFRLMDMRDLYQEVILDHNRKPRNFGPLEGANRNAHGYNPLCGDDYEIHVLVEDGVVQDIGFEGEGCAISKAAASMMTSRVKGKPVADAETLIREFRQMMAGELDDGVENHLGHLEVFEGVSKLPNRIKCAVLPWHTLNAALQGEESISTEGNADEWGDGGGDTSSDPTR